MTFAPHTAMNAQRRRLVSRAGAVIPTEAGIAAARRPAAGSRQPTIPRAFTLIELLIAVVVLLAVILVTAQIFGTASRITSTGQATIAVMQEAAAIENRLRADLARLSPEGFFAIRQVAVPNDVRGPGLPLLNPALPEDYILRADQLVFFTDGVHGMQTFGIGGQGGTANQSQGTATRIYWGHAFQLPQGLPYDVISPSSPAQGHAHDPAQDILPWHFGDVAMSETLFSTIEGAGGPDGIDVYGIVTAPTAIEGTQPDARRWLLARQAIVLADDDQGLPDTNAKTSYLNNRMARSIVRWDGEIHDIFGWTREIRNGRMDGAASELHEIRRYIRLEDFWDPANSAIRDWLDQRNLISNEFVYYPRAERTAPSMHRVDQALTNHVIGSAVSSFIVEWTWENGTGEVLDDDGEVQWDGFWTNSFDNTHMQPEQPWFGLDLFGDPDASRGVGFYGNADYRELANFLWAQTIDRFNVERYFEANVDPFYVDDYPDAHVYEAIFGFNRDTPVAPNPANNFTEEPFSDLGYTPWPSAIRVTMVLHDAAGVLENGREFQFVIDLPRRAR